MSIQSSLEFIDSDGHILEAPTGMVEFAPGEYRDRIWHIETGDDGKEWIVYNGNRHRAIGGSGTAGFTREERERVMLGEVPYSEVRPAGWDATLRLEELDSEGINISVLYPTLLLNIQGETDVKFARAQVRAYNDWCTDHLKNGKGRLFGAGALPPIHSAEDVKDLVDEIYRVADLPGMVGVFMRPNPAIEWRPFNDPAYDPIWAAASETGLPIGFHPFLTPDLPGAAQGLKLNRARNADGRYVSLEEMDAQEAAALAAGMQRKLTNVQIQQAIANPVDMMSAIAFITSGGVAERFPKAKFVFLEAGGGWLVSWLERLDHHADKYSFDTPWLKMKPSEYFCRQCWISFDPDETTLQMTAESPLVGADRIIWASDFPHSDARYPGVTQTLLEQIGGLSEAQQHAIASGSARALYGI
jgi:uncharacterized protein